MLPSGCSGRARLQRVRVLAEARVILPLPFFPHHVGVLRPSFYSILLPCGHINFFASLKTEDTGSW